MELTIKNDDLGAIFDRVIAEGEGDPVLEGRTPEQAGQDMVAAYALDIVRNGMYLGKEIQFIYEDFADLPAAVAACYRSYRKRETVTYGVQGTAKNLAAYFFALAWNEQNLPWEVCLRPVLMNPMNEPDFSNWLNFTVRVKGKDFLRAINDGMQIIRGSEKRFVSFNLNPLIAAYEQATGVNLAAKGLVNIFFDR